MIIEKAIDGRSHTDASAEHKHGQQLGPMARTRTLLAWSSATPQPSAYYLPNNKSWHINQLNRNAATALERSQAAFSNPRPFNKASTPGIRPRNVV